MKKLLFAFSLLGSLSLFASPLEPNQRVLNSFKKLFSTATDINWSESRSAYGPLYDVTFHQADKMCRITYDQEGNLLRSLRYYKEENLPLQIVKAIKEEYPTQQIFGVVEENMNNVVNYNVTLEDQNSWIDIKSDNVGNLSVKKIFNKG